MTSKAKEKPMNLFKPKNFSDVILGVLLFIVLCPFYFKMDQFVSGGMATVTSPVDFPKFIIGIVVILSLLLIILGIFIKKVQLDEDLEQKINNRAVVLYLALLVFYLLGLKYIGFLISTPIVMTLSYALFRGNRFITFIPFTIAFAFGINYIAFNFMNIMLPAGIFFE